MSGSAPGVLAAIQRSPTAKGGVAAGGLLAAWRVYEQIDKIVSRFERAGAAAAVEARVEKQHAQDVEKLWERRGKDKAVLDRTREQIAGMEQQHENTRQRIDELRQEQREGVRAIQDELRIQRQVPVYAPPEPGYYPAPPSRPTPPPHEVTP